MKREKPDKVSTQDFENFEKFADKHGIGTETEDCEPWWECWLDGYECGYES